MGERKFGECEICGASPASAWRCHEHWRCDDCGSREQPCYRNGGVLCDECHKARMDAKIAEIERKPIDTKYESEAICPWCGYRHSDSWEMSEGEHECHDCERRFELSKCVEVTYSTSKVR